MSRKRKGGDPERKGAARHGPDPAARGDSTERRQEPVEAPAGQAADEQEYTELVLLVHAANPAEAELFKTELATHGIPAFLEGEGAGVAGIPDVGAGVPVLVPEEYADQAAEFIAELESAKPEGNALDEKENLFDEDEEDLEDLDDVEDLEDEDLEEDEEEDEEDDVDEDEDLDEEPDKAKDDKAKDEDEDEDEDENDEDWDDEDDEDVA